MISTSRAGSKVPDFGHFGLEGPGSRRPAVRGGQWHEHVVRHRKGRICGDPREFTELVSKTMWMICFRRGVLRASVDQVSLRGRMNLEKSASSRSLCDRTMTIAALPLAQDSALKHTGSGAASGATLKLVGMPVNLSRTQAGKGCPVDIGDKPKTVHRCPAEAPKGGRESAGTDEEQGVG